jgi:hypothetical protein
MPGSVCTTRIEQISLTPFVRAPLARAGQPEVLATDGLGVIVALLGWDRKAALYRSV